MGQIHVDDMTRERYCVPICVILGQNLQEQCPKMCFAKIGLMVALEEPLLPFYEYIVVKLTACHTATCYALVDLQSSQNLETF